MILGQDHITTWAVVVFALVMVFSQGAVKAFLDATYGHPKINPGPYWDTWHIVGRTDMFLDGLAWALVGALSLRMLGYPLWLVVCIVFPPVVVITLTGKGVFRAIAGKFKPHWYKDSASGEMKDR